MTNCPSRLGSGPHRKRGTLFHDQRIWTGPDFDDVAEGTALQHLKKGIRLAVWRAALLTAQRRLDINRATSALAGIP